MVHTVLPALEALHSVWSLFIEANDYTPFHDALQAALDKVAEYYKKTLTTHAYTFSMCKMFMFILYPQC